MPDDVEVDEVASKVEVETRKSPSGIEFKVIPVHQIVDVLKGDELIRAMALVIEETAIMEALVMIHGKERGAERYVDAGGHLRFQAEGDVLVLLWPEGGVRGKEGEEHCYGG